MNEYIEKIKNRKMKMKKYVMDNYDPFISVKTLEWVCERDAFLF